MEPEESIFCWFYFMFEVLGIALPINTEMPSIKNTAGAYPIKLTVQLNEQFPLEIKLVC